MKTTKILFTITFSALFFSCSNERMSDASNEACRLINAYEKYKKDPDGERTWMNVYSLQSEFNSTIESEGFKISEVKDAMTDCKENKELLEEASKIKLSNNN